MNINTGLSKDSFEHIGEGQQHGNINIKNKHILTSVSTLSTYHNC